MVMYINFYGFKNHILPQNLYVIAFSFIEKREFMVKLTETLNFSIVKPIFQISYT
jgi:hypothetical protein